MTDLLTLGWPWFAGTVALGALIGFLATSQEKNAPSAPGWLLLALVATLAAGMIASAGGLFAGRDALTFDIALLAFGGYVLGLPLGRVVKLAGAQSAKQSASQSSRPIIVAAAAPVAKVAEMDIPSAPEAKAVAPVADLAPIIDARLAASTVEDGIDAAARAARELSEKVAHLRAPAESKSAGKAKGGKAVDKSPSGAKPGTLAAPRGGKADDLSRIKGLGPKSVQKLHEIGVFHYDQIAGWSAENAKWIGAAIGVPGRVERDKWVAQAGKLSAKAASNAA